MRVEDPEQRPDREVIEGATSSRDGAGYEPPPRTAESSVSADLIPENRAMTRTWAILRVTEETQRVGCGGKRNKESQDQRPR